MFYLTLLKNQAFLEPSQDDIFSRFSADQFIVGLGQLSLLTISSLPFNLKPTAFADGSGWSIWLFHFHVKGTVPWDFRLKVFFMNQFPPSPPVYHQGRFKFCSKFSIEKFIYLDKFFLQVHFNVSAVWYCSQICHRQQICHRYQQYQQYWWQICHRCSWHRWQICRQCHW